MSFVISGRLLIKSTSAIRGILTAALLLNVIGCGQNDQISRTTEKHDDFGRPQTRPKVESGSGEKVPTRLLGAIAETGNGQSWFFKMMGPAEAVARQSAAFDEFLASVQFNDGKEKPVSWTLPAGWREGPASAPRLATLSAGQGADAVELSVMPAGGSLLENVNRWRGQVDLPPVTQDSLRECCREVTTGQGKKVMRVDLTGMAGKGGAMMPPFMQMKGR